MSASAAATRFDPQPVLAGLLAALVGYASTFALVLAGFAAVGASPAEAASGLLALCLAQGLLNIVGAWRTRMPLSFAWSTPGAAFLISLGTLEGGFGAATGGFLMAAALVVLAGIWAPFARAVSMIPASIANAMLAGILLTLCLAPLQAIEAAPTLALPIVLSWAIGLVFFRRYAVPLAVLVTIFVLSMTTQLPPGALDGSLPALVPVLPVFTLDAFLRIALPLFVITMASQNLPGIAVMKANGYDVAPAPLFVATGLLSAVAALFGGHATNLAAITAAINAGPEAHPDPARRWPASVTTGIAYLVLGLVAGLAAAFITASPPVLIQAVAGLALLSSLAGALANALASDDELPAILTFVTAASGITIIGIGAAFWGLVAGIVLLLLLRWRARP
ncbi:MAG: benzoate transporter BenE [Caulobacteraceae bacterium]|nr:MAG: benzoate transporter BenE [Caulobacteraceae bacterium]